MKSKALSSTGHWRGQGQELETLLLKIQGIISGTHQAKYIKRQNNPFTSSCPVWSQTVSSDVFGKQLLYREKPKPVS